MDTRQGILVPTESGEVKIRFRAMPKARKPSASEEALGVGDASRDRVQAMARP